MPALSVVERRVDEQTLTIADDGTLSDAFDFSRYASGLVYIPATWTAANMGFKVSSREGGTYTLLLDDAGAPVQIGTVSTSRAGWYKMPDKLFPAAWVKLWSKSATAATETDVQQTGGPLSIIVLLKG